MNRPRSWLRAIQPLVDHDRFPGHQVIQKGLRFRIHHQQLAMFSTEESLFHRMVQECDQRIEMGAAL
jgi:hypothetical protein